MSTNKAGVDKQRAVLNLVKTRLVGGNDTQHGIRLRERIYDYTESGDIDGKRDRR